MPLLSPVGCRDPSEGLWLAVLPGDVRPAGQPARPCPAAGGWHGL